MYDNQSPLVDLNPNVGWVDAARSKVPDTRIRAGASGRQGHGYPGAKPRPASIANGCDVNSNILTLFPLPDHILIVSGRADHRALLSLPIGQPPPPLFLPGPSSRRAPLPHHRPPPSHACRTNHRSDCNISASPDHRLRVPWLLLLGQPVRSSPVLAVDRWPWSSLPPPAHSPEPRFQRPITRPYQPSIPLSCPHTSPSFLQHLPPCRIACLPTNRLSLLLAARSMQAWLF
jgi:hypothetical protein